jgi:hypothetical protein
MLTLPTMVARISATIKATGRIKTRRAALVEGRPGGSVDSATIVSSRSPETSPE